LKVAILDDYQNVALMLADRSAVRWRAEISVFNDHVADTAVVVDTQAANDLGIAVTATGYESTATIEFIWSPILASIRHLHRETASVRNGG
jgi:hypothetical protein